MINSIFLYTSYFYLKWVLDIFIIVYLHHYFNQFVNQLKEPRLGHIPQPKWKNGMIQLHAAVVCIYRDSVPRFASDSSGLHLWFCYNCK